ncbi:Ig-like domain-containing protein [Geotalea uraniireducens]|uniref:Uncharacterized protein n=1 Tax=Geotalea uraniireducens (strain Rf4) TaxID=351605 RepID=A5GAN6_GEOUR|nr:Ig-like domain-containing protein [Geotalea uraniireducens]ABQ25365.1 hypothetical protein Gura_1161 [Geotalea uraniireducens Rf4]
MHGLVAHKNLFFVLLFITILLSVNEVYALTIDSVKRTSPAEPTTNAASVDYTVIFSEAVTGLTASNFTVPVTGISGAGVTSVTGSGTTWTATVGTGSGDGTLGFTMENSTGVTDTVGNAVANLPFDGEIYTIDKTVPTVTIGSTAANPTSVSPLPVTVTFSEAVTGFTAEDIVVGNGTAGAFAGSGATYTFNVTPTANGPVTVDIAAGAALDAAGNGNSAAVQFSRNYDNSAPTVTIGSTAADPTRVSPIPVTVTFSEAVTGFAAEDIVVGNGTAGAFAGSGATYTFNVTPTANGPVTVDIAAGAALDAAGNGNSAAVQFSRNYDNTTPTVTIGSMAADPTNVSPIPVTVTFSEAVTGFAAEDIVVGNGTAGAFAGSGATYTFNVTPTATGPVTVDIASGAAQDAAGNGNSAASQLSRNYDNTVPTVTIGSTAANPTNVSPITVTVTFSEAVTGFAAGDITVGNGTVTSGSFTGSGATYTFSVIPTANGAMTVAIAAGVAQDAAGNGNSAAVQFSRNYDNTVPTVTIGSTAANPTRVSPIPVTVTFSEAVIGFAAGDITVGNGTVTSGSFAGSGATYTFSVTPTANGAVTVDVAVGVAQDAAGNGNSASSRFSRIYDNTAPTMDAAASYVNSTHVDVTFSEGVIGADVAANYTAPGLTITAAVSQGGATYRLTTSLQGIGTTYNITANNISDPAGNALSSSDKTATFTRTSASNSAPTTPTLNAPPNGTFNVNEVNTLTPTLAVNNSTDVDLDPLSYTFVVDTVNTFDSPNKKTSTLVPSGAGTTSWTIPSSSPLVDNTTWYWRVTATDGNKGSSPSQTGSFFVNTVNDAPAGLAVSSPTNDPKTEVTDLQPLLTVTNATDLDNDTLTYEFEVATDGSFTNVVAKAVTGVAQGTAGTTTWKVSPALNDNTQYHWRSRAKDQHGLPDSSYSGWVTATFFTNTSNDAPSAPTVNAPLNNNEISTTLTPTLTINNSTDPDRDPLTYTFEIDTDNKFNSPNKQTSPVIAEDAGTTTTSWTPATLSDNTIWYWRVKVTDIHNAEAWMSTGPDKNYSTFFINQFNEAPTVPVVTSPAENGEVDSLNPILTVNATDIDQDPLTYDFEVYSDISLNSSARVARATDQGPNWTVVANPPLVDNTRYYWIVSAKDVHGVYSGWMAASSFIVKNKGDNNLPPSIEITSPGAAEPVTNAKTFTIGWNAADPDSPAFITLYYGNDTSGNDLKQIVSGISKDDTVKSFNWDTSLLSDGPYYVYGKIEDGKSTIYAHSAGPLVIDRTPPNVPVVSGPTLTNSPTPTWSWSSGGGGGNGTYRYKLGNNDLTTGATETAGLTFVPGAALGEGNHTLYVQERDLAGNWSDNGSFAIEVDTVAPTATLSGAPTGETQATSATLTVGGDGVVAYKFQHRYNQGIVADYADETPVSVPISRSTLGEGGHTIAVIGRDSAGNWQASETTTSWIVDTIPPMAVIKDAPPDPNNRTNVNLTVGGDGVVAYRYKLDDGAYSAETPIATMINLASLAEGTHTVAVIGRDSAGNWQAEANAKIIGWMADLTVPALSVSTLPDGSFTSKAELNITGSVTDANLVRSLVLNFTADGVVGSDNLTVDANDAFNYLLTLSAGVNVITITATDMAGNQMIDTRTITYDSSGPQITISAPADNIKTGKPTVDVKVGTDEPAIVEIVVYDGSQTELSRKSSSVPDKSFAATLDLVYNINTLVVTATDATGNKSSDKRTVIYDNQKPTLAITDPAQDIRTDLSIMTLKGVVSDTLGAVTVTVAQLTQDGNAEVLNPPPTLTDSETGQTFEQSITFTGNRVYRFVVTATDEVGNETSVQRNIVYAKPSRGDLNGDRNVDILDALTALQISTGLVAQTDIALINGDVAPLVNGKSVPDGRIDVGDAVIILKVVVNLITL